LAAPFWMGVFAWQPSTATAPRLLPVQGEPHAHLVVGNVSGEQLDTVLAGWPERGRFCVVTPVTHAWGALHYCLSQTRIARTVGESNARYLNRVKSDHMRGHDALLNCPFDSDLELREVIMKLRTLHKKTMRPRTPEAVGVAKHLATTRWPIRIVLDGVFHHLIAPEARPVVKLAVLLYTVSQVQDQEIAA
jgi:hypothetical protein